jgi:hypothetical protein
MTLASALRQSRSASFRFPEFLFRHPERSREPALSPAEGDPVSTSSPLPKGQARIGRTEFIGTLAVVKCSRLERDIFVVHRRDVIAAADLRRSAAATAGET